MTKRYLIDTCIWRDYFEDRVGRNKNPLGKYAKKFIFNIMKKKDEILFVSKIIQELKNNYEDKEIQDMMTILSMLVKIEWIEVTKKQFEEAEDISRNRNLPFPDCLYAVLARDNKAIMITQDNHFFKNLTDIANIKRPQELI